MNPILDQFLWYAIGTAIGVAIVLAMRLMAREPLRLRTLVPPVEFAASLVVGAAIATAATRDLEFVGSQAGIVVGATMAACALSSLITTLVNHHREMKLREITREQIRILLAESAELTQLLYTAGDIETARRGREKIAFATLEKLGKTVPK